MTRTLAGYRLNYKADLPDFRDKRLCTPAHAVAALPDVFGVDWDFSIRDQGSAGTCTGQAVVNAYAAAERTRWNPATNSWDYLNFQPWHSALFVYAAARIKDGSFAEGDCGESIRNTIKAASEFGVCHESLWPYDVAKVNVRPPKRAWNAALKSQVESYRAVEIDFDQVCAAIFNGEQRLAVTFGHMVHERFDATPKSGIVPMPRRGWIYRDKPLGGHAQVLVGFDRKKRLVRGVNSWGTGWGDNGLCWFPWEYLRRYGVDFWVVNLVEKQ